ncbi:GntR family transcriptional regulator [Brachybacterium paraconglomeratum]|uniref:GntR family transcriptional regulator n=1 Tax=Brachybacterium paraconglomeratum TaxID=173362 RepID=UPI00223BC5C6|nr:GntR family transcriptional regulator [Brachybacterium paraconglomeratum]MCT1437368.1 GntR family transcriptional regulator [Brachybacterium paraconglomeratum]
MKMRSMARDSILRRMADGSLTAGDWVREETLAAELGISRTPVREAVRELASEGVLETLRNRGTRVPTSSSSELNDSGDLRVLLECLALRRLLERDEGTGVMDLRAAAEAFEEAAGTTPLEVSALVAAEATFHSALVQRSGDRAVLAAYRTLPVLAQTRASLAAAEDVMDVSRSQFQLIEAIEADDVELAVAVLTLHLRRFAAIARTPRSRALEDMGEGR